MGSIILDHCSVTYGQCDSIDGVDVANITISNSIIAFPIGQQFGAHIEGNQATYFGNLWVSGHNRHPLTKANSQYINNVVYNYQAAYTVANIGDVFSHDVINNYFIAGPSTTSVSNYYYQVDASQNVYAKGNYADTISFILASHEMQFLAAIPIPKLQTPFPFPNPRTPAR